MIPTREAFCKRCNQVTDHELEDINEGFMCEQYFWECVVCGEIEIERK